MKRIAAFLVVAALCLSLCACQSGVDPKYQAVIDQLENGNYQNAIDLIENMATLDKGENDENNNGGNAGDAGVEDSNKQPELTQEQIAWKEKVVGNWFADDRATEAGHTGFAVKEDGTCTVDGQSYTWTIGNASETNAWVEVKNGQTNVYGLQFSKHIEYGYKRATLFEYTGEHNSTSTDGVYYCTEEYNVVEITTGNWQEYFEIVEVCNGVKNAFGEINDFSCATYFRLKESCGKVNSAISYGGTEYQFISACQDVTVNLTDMTYVVAGEIRNTSEHSSVTEWHSSTDGNNTPYYGVTIGSFRAYDVNKDLTDTVWRPTNIQIPRVEGTLYLIK